jgi:ABC-type polysaccharide/polyol phosphate transport system ATPase subunit
VNAGAEIIFLDEVFAVGDEKFRAKAIKVFEQAWLEGRTVVMVTHSLGNIEKYCDRAIYLKKGKMEFMGDPKEAIRLYQVDNKA